MQHILVKKYLPFAAIGAAVLIIAAFFLSRTGGNVSAMLKPSDDRHWLKLTVEGISPKAKSMEYELIYQLPDGRTQGVPGKVDLEGKTSFERDILLGSESAGKYTYDDGVDYGSLNLRFYTDKDNLIKKYEVDWNINELPDNPKVI
jgi:hypothetical protein